MRKFSKKSNAILLGAVASIGSLATVAWAGTSTNTAGPVQQGQSDGGTGNPALNNPAVTISFSGQTALKSFFISSAVTELEPGTSIVLHDGTSGAPITYTATNDGNTTAQLANKSFLTPDKNPGTPTSPSTSDVQIASAVRLEWHEEGSIDGFVDLLNDQVGYVQTGNPTTDPLSQEALRTPSTPNPTVVNQNTFTAGGSIGGFNLDNSAADQLNQTYNTSVYNQATGANLLGGQNRVQFSVGEFPTEALAVSGSASPFAKPGAAGYGQGNTVLKGGTTSQTLTQLGSGNSRQQFQPVTAANESSDKIDPNTGSAYTAGPWNTAGANNVTSTAFAVTAVTYSANPGTGLYRIDLGDAQWLQTTGRLANGALFNVVARTVNTGQRAVFALNTGIDPTWAVGSNDDGNSTSSTAATAQHSVGTSLRFDGKTSGSEAATTIAASRMAVGALSVPEARAVSGGVVRALDVDFNDQTDVNSADDSLSSNKFVRADFSTIVSDGSVANGPHYGAVLISHVNTVKAPDPTALFNEEKALGFVSAGDNNVSDATNISVVSAANQATAWGLVNSFDPATAQTDSTPATAAISGIKGDSTGDAAALISNIVNADGTAAANLSPSSANNPADGLFGLGFLIPGLLDYTRNTDGQTITPVTLSASALTEQATVQANYGTFFTTDQSAGANANTTGGSTFYGGTGSSNGIAVNGNIPITAKDVTSSGGILTVTNSNAANGDATAAGGNYLFGNFNQNGVRDYSAVQEAVNAAISLYNVDGAAGGKNSIFTPDGGVTNSTAITTSATPGDSAPGWLQTGTNTKGDLIALGDYNGDGKFDGADLYLFAIGASLADSTSSNTLTATVLTFSDALRNPNAVLRKNAALDFINAQLNQSFANVIPAGATLSPSAFLRQSGRAVLSVGVSTVPAGATDLSTTDPITGFEQFTYDPNGAFAFDKHDVNRDGVVDFNDAILVDNDNGQSYTNLTQSLAATQQAPVSGAIEPISLVAVQQIDGEPAISAADLTQLNTGLTGTGNTNWYGYNVQKTGPGTINYGRTGGTVIVYSGASFQISSGTVNVGKSASGTVAGAIDPFTDSTSTGINTSKSVALTVTGGTLDYVARTGISADTGLKLYKLNSLSISNGQVNLDSAASSANRSLIVVGQLSFPPSSTGSLNLGSNDLIVAGAGAAGLATITAEASQGYNGPTGAWTGTGLTTSAGTKANNPLSNTGLAVVLAGATTPATTSFDNEPVGSNDVLVKYTFFGDADLSGTVNATDYLAIDNGFNSHLTGWQNGDFNYDGTINGDDYTLIDNAFNTQGSVNFSAIGAAPAELVANGTAQISTAVPEPSSVVLLTIGAAGLITRRRRRS